MLRRPPDRGAMSISRWPGKLAFAAIVLGVAAFLALARARACFAAGVSSAGPTEEQRKLKLVVAVVDETGVAVSSARVILIRGDGGSELKGETDDSGRYEFTNLERGLYHLRVEKEGFYAVKVDEVRVG